MDTTQFIDFSDADIETAGSTSVAFLAQAGESDWLTLFEHCVRIPFQADDEVICQGDLGRSLFIVAQGELETIILNEHEPQKVQLALIPTHSVFGEQAFFDGQPRSATIRACTDGELLELTMERFEALAAIHPRLAHMILFDLGRIISLRLRTTTKVFINAIGPAAVHP